MPDAASLAEIEARFATERVTPQDFFQTVQRLLDRGESTPESAELLRLAYLANPLNSETDKELVRSAPALDPDIARRAAQEAGAGGIPGRARPRRTPDAAVEREERDQLLGGISATHSLPRPEDAPGIWQAAQAAFQAGQWDEARRLAQSLSHLSSYRAQIQEFLHSVDRHEDFVLPELQGLAAGLTSARRREAWQDVDQIWQRAQAIVEAEQRHGVPARMPQALVEQYTRATNAQEAKPLVQQAVRLRRQGDFVEADTLLAEAIKLDPDNAVILAERERCGQGMTKLASLRALMGKAHLSPAEVVAGLEDTATLEQLAPEGRETLELARSLRSLREEMGDRLQARAEQLLDEIDRRPSLSEKWALCGDASRCVDDLARLSPERREVTFLEERLERVSARITRAQDLAQGLTSALDAARGTALTPIQAARLISDLVDAQAIAPDDLSLRSLGARIAEAIAASLSSPQYLLREPDRFDLATFYAVKDLVRLLSDCPGNPGPQALAGYRHALLAKAAQAVVTRLDQGLAERQTAAALGPIEEALQLAAAMHSLPEADSVQAVSELIDRISSQVRRWIYLRFLSSQTLEEMERTAGEVADMLSHLQSLPGTPLDVHSEREREFVATLQQALRHEVSPQTLRTLPLAEATKRVARAREFITYSLPMIFQRLGSPERARSAALLEVLALAQEHIDQRQSRQALLHTAAPIAAAIAGLIAVAGVLLLAFPGLRPGAGSGGSPQRVLGPEPSLAGVQGYDCEHLDDHNVCDVPLGPQFKSFYARPDMRARLGAPLTSMLREVEEVQYFEFGRLEFHSLNPPPHNYQFGLLGAFVARQRAAQDRALRAALEPALSDPNRGRYYLETSHHISDRNGFLRYFDLNGGVYAFGYPLSEEYQQDGKVLQYFQRARFEGRPGEPTSVRLGPVGIEYLQEVLGARLCHRLLNNLGECR